MTAESIGSADIIGLAIGIAVVLALFGRFLQMTGNLERFLGILRFLRDILVEVWHTLEEMWNKLRGDW